MHEKGVHKIRDEPDGQKEATDERRPISPGLFSDSPEYNGAEEHEVVGDTACITDNVGC